MRQIGKCFGGGLALGCLSLVLVVGVSRTGFSKLPADTLPILLGAVVLVSVVMYIRTTLLGVSIAALAAVLLISRQYNPHIARLHIILYLSAIIAGDVCVSHPGWSLLLLAVITSAQLYKGPMWQIGISVCLAVAMSVANLFTPHLVQHYHHLSRSLGRQARGLIVFLFSYGMAIMAFAVLYGCVDAWKGPKSLTFQWLSGEAPSFGHYVLLSFMAISRNPVAVQPTDSIAFALLSLESLVGVLLFAIVLRELLIATDTLRERQSSK